MTRRIEQINDGSDCNPGDDMEDNPNFDDPENYEDDISEQGKSTYRSMLSTNSVWIPYFPQQILWET